MNIPDMSIDRTVVLLTEVPFKEGRLVHLSDIPAHAMVHQVENFIDQQGFRDATLYWPSSREVRPSDLAHEGRCMVEFVSKDQAQYAMNKLRDSPCRGSTLSTATPKLTDFTPPDSVSYACAPVASQTSLSAEKLPVAFSSLNFSSAQSPFPTSLTSTATTESDSITTPFLYRRAIKVDPLKMRERMDKLEYPDAYIATENWGPEDRRYASTQYKKMTDEEDKRRGTFLPRVVTRKDGVERVRGYQVLFNVDDPLSEIKVLIDVIKFEDGVPKIETILPEQLPPYEENGWKEWFKETLTDEERADRDREIAKTLAFHNLINER
ncbi:hypothetical protein ACHAPJ_003810 [Fusarium lateritium]